MNIDAAQFSKIVLAVFETDQGQLLTRPAAEGILGIAQLAIDADLRQDEDELAVLGSLRKRVWSLATVDGDPEIAALELSPGDTEARVGAIRTLAERLTKPNRELAFSIAYVLTIADIDIAPEEDAFIEQLQLALSISDERADMLIDAIGEALATASA